MKAKIDTWDYIKLKSCCTAKETLDKVKRELTEWDKILSNYATDKGLLPRLYKELQKLHNNKVKNLFKKWVKDMNRNFLKDENKWAKDR